MQSLSPQMHTVAFNGCRLAPDEHRQPSARKTQRSFQEDDAAPVQLPTGFDAQLQLARCIQSRHVQPPPIWLSEQKASMSSIVGALCGA